MSSSACASRAIRKKKDWTCRFTTSAGTTFKRDRGSLLERALRRPFLLLPSVYRLQSTARHIGRVTGAVHRLPLAVDCRLWTVPSGCDRLLILTSKKGLS